MARAIKRKEWQRQDQPHYRYDDGDKSLIKHHKMRKMKTGGKQKRTQAQRLDRNFPGDLFIQLNPILDQNAATLHQEEKLYREAFLDGHPAQQ